MAYFEIIHPFPWLYGIKEDDVYCWLAVGEKRALLFDTCYGVGDLRKTVSEITDLPLDVVLGHGHVDHANGAYQFGGAYIHPADIELCREHTSEQFRRGFAEGAVKEGRAPEGFDLEKYIKAGTGELKELKIGQIFDLGGFTFEVIPMYGHTAGSIGLLSPEKKTLLVSDSANGHMWLFLNESLTIAEYVKMLEKTLELDFDTLILAHDGTPQPKEAIHKYIRSAKNATVEKAKPYNASRDRKAYIYEEGGAAICFNERTLV
jgi:glyoxylase-like metal-dependent hydrolase (beta-lactamase superfamily II)